MSAKNTNVALANCESNNDVVMVPEAPMIVRVVIQDATRGFEVFYASAWVQLVRVFQVVGVGSNRMETDGWRRTPRD